MGFKNFWSRTGRWFGSGKLSKGGEYRPVIDDKGLIDEEGEQAREQSDQEQQDQSSQVVVKTVQPKDKSASIEKLQEGFNRLIDRLEGINEHLNRQVAQNEELMKRMEHLPKLLESFPGAVENQKQAAEQLLEQLRATSAKEQQFVDAVEKIPAETAKQTDALANIDHQLAAAADTDVQMTESFNKFNETLDKLNQSTMSQTDGIMQMSKTFATSDRYLKYVISRQSKRFMWIFMTALAVCVVVVLILTGIIIYIKH